MDHKAAIAALSLSRKAALQDRSDSAGLRHLAGHLGLIALCAAPIALRLPGTLNISFPGVDAEKLIRELDGLAVSSGAATLFVGTLRFT